MPPKRFEGKFGIPPSHPVESLLTQALYRLPESITPVFIERFVNDVAGGVDQLRRERGEPPLTEGERHTLGLKLARHYEDNGESANIDRPTFIDALVESPKFLQSDRGSIEKLFEIHEMKTLQKIAEIRRRRAEITSDNIPEFNPYENLFTTESGKYYLARLLNMPHLEEESEYMEHCVGTSTSYVNKMKRGDVEIFSFRDTQSHKPIVTIEYDTKSHRLLQVKASLDRIPNLSDFFAPDLLEALEKLPETLNDNEKPRIVTSNEVAHLTWLLELHEKIKAKTELTRDDLLFLYEVNEPIQGFDKDEHEPLIDTLLQSRDRRADIVLLANCAPEHLAREFTALNADTEVYCEDTGTKVILCDFREAQNQAKLPHLLELAQMLKEIGSPARPDLAFEGGIISLSISPEMQEKLKDWPTARNAYEQADNTSPSWVYEELKNIPWTPPASTSLDILVLNHGNTTLQDRTALVTNMDKVGYRSLTFAELVALGVNHPDFNKRNEVLNTLETHTLGGKLRYPCFLWVGGKRSLDAGWADSDWVGHDRFLFVRKS